jgi:tetratricopeptide (TPR) repeat protein
MRTPHEAVTPSPLGRLAPVLAAALLASACTLSGTTRPAPVETRDENGFTIREEVRVGAALRADFERAVRLLEQERYEQGIALLVQVTEAAPHLTTAHIDLGIAYGRVEDLERAEASIKRALELNPRHPVAHNELGIVYRRTGRFEAARESYERALALYPDFHFARRNLAILCDLYLADASCAMEHYEIYTRAVPDDPAAAMWVADLRNRIGR